MTKFQSSQQSQFFTARPQVLQLLVMPEDMHCWQNLKIFRQLQSQTEKINIVFNSPSNHFKSCYEVFEMAKLLVPMEWICSVGHRKGPCDGVRGLLNHHGTKHNISRQCTAAIQAQKILHAQCNHTHQHPLSCCPNRKLKNSASRKSENFPTKLHL